MSKELNIIEASNMPVGTEFKVVFNNGQYDIVMLKPTADEREFVSKSIGNRYDFTSAIINAKFIPIQKPVSFMDLVKDTQGKKVYVEFDTNCEQYSNVFIPKESDYFREYLYDIIKNNSDYNVRKIISEGKWFIEY